MCSSTRDVETQTRPKTRGTGTYNSNHTCMLLSYAISGTQTRVRATTRDAAVQCTLLHVPPLSWCTSADQVESDAETVDSEVASEADMDYCDEDQDCSGILEW